MPALNDRAWVWGYVLSSKGRVGPDSKPWQIPFVGESHCSLETAAAYLGASNVVAMNNSPGAMTPDYLDKLRPFRQVLWGLAHGDYEGSARKLGRLSARYPNLAGGLIDDFLDYHGPSKAITPEHTRAIQAALKESNPALSLYAVQYTWQDLNALVPFLPWIDGISLWVWVASLYDWQVKMDFFLEQYKARTGKPILLGLFLHDYGGSKQPMAMDVLELQFQKALAYVKSGLIEGFVVLQSGWFDRETHRLQVQWVRRYLDWAFGSWTAS